MLIQLTPGQTARNFIFRSALVAGTGLGGMGGQFLVFKFLQDDTGLQSKILMIVTGAFMGIAAVLALPQNSQENYSNSVKHGILVSSLAGMTVGIGVGLIAGSAGGAIASLVNNIGISAYRSIP